MNGIGQPIRVMGLDYPQQLRFDIYMFQLIFLCLDVNKFGKVCCFPALSVSPDDAASNSHFEIIGHEDWILVFL